MKSQISTVIRVRPFNQTDKDKRCVVSVSDNTVFVQNLRNPQFKVLEHTYSKCYWSVNDHKQGVKAVKNVEIFQQIGIPIIQHFYEGFNSTVFAYGQTGSGKSYTIEGNQYQKGLLQMWLTHIFKYKIPSDIQSGKKSVVRVSYIEIYNEQVRDLLNPKNKDTRKIYVQNNQVNITNILKCLCSSEQQALKLFNNGKVNRVQGAHNMNNQSSRSHAIFTIYYESSQKSGQLSNKVTRSKFNIVDLAGSQRQNKTQATGVRLMEGTKINLSLTYLGQVISTLSRNIELNRHDHVGYYNSKLTMILSQSLGGNSKTCMIAAISPSAFNCEETISTLQFAAKAAKIVLSTNKNVIQKIKPEIQLNNLILQKKRLQQQLQNNKNLTQKQKEQMQKQIKKCQQLQRRIIETKNEDQEIKQFLKNFGIFDKQQQIGEIPYIMNISEDPTLSGIIIFYLSKQKTTIGCQADNDIKLNSLGIQTRHCSITRNEKQFFIQPEFQSHVFVNGRKYLQKKILNHLDQLSFGHGNNFKFIDPQAKMIEKIIPPNKQDFQFYPQYLKDRINENSDQAKALENNLQQLKQKLDPYSFDIYISKFNDLIQEVDRANNYTSFRYKKFPLQNRNIEFQINLIDNLGKGENFQPNFIIKCENKSAKEIQFIWSEKKFLKRLAQMQQWYKDVAQNNIVGSTYNQYDPWFEASDDYIKEKGKIQLMEKLELRQYWDEKIQMNQRMLQQTQIELRKIINKLKNKGYDEQITQVYADAYILSNRITDNYRSKVQAMRKDKKIDKKIRKMVEKYALRQKCRIDDKFLQLDKEKYLIFSDVHNKINTYAQSYSSIIDNIEKLESMNKKYIQQIKKLTKR